MGSSQGDMSPAGPTTRSAAARQYQEIGVIGHGAYGTVYKGRDMRTGRFIAIKKMTGPLSEDGIPPQTLREIAMLKQLEKFDNPNVVKLLDVCRRSDTDARLKLIFEFVDYDLAAYVHRLSERSELTHTIVKKLFCQMMSGVDFLHFNRIVHRDIKPQNILVTSDGVVKLADFGLSRLYSYHMVLTSVVVTLWYRSPEVLLQSTYGSSVDMWALGCILAELFTGRPLFRGHSEVDQLRKIFEIRGLPPESEWPEQSPVLHGSFAQYAGQPLEGLVRAAPPDAMDLIEKLLTFNNLARISASQALKHPYLEEMSLTMLTNHHVQHHRDQHVVVTGGGGGDGGGGGGDAVGGVDGPTAAAPPATEPQSNGQDPNSGGPPPL